MRPGTSNPPRFYVCLCVFGCFAVLSGTAHALDASPADATEAPPEPAAARFLADVAEYAAGLQDDTLTAASIPFFRNTASYNKAIEIKPARLRAIYSTKIGWVARKGCRYILFPAEAVSEGLPSVVVLVYVNGVFRIDLVASYEFRAPGPPDPDPRNHFPTLAEALVGIDGDGPLTAEFNFGPGATISCRLLPDEAPLTVANFVVLARGLRFVRTDVVDAVEGTVEWAKIPWYDGIKGVVSFGRRALTIGRGENPGFVVADEMSFQARHDAPALLTTVPDSPDRWSGTIAITAAPVGALDGVGTIFGVCDERAVEKLLDRAWHVRFGVPAIPRLLNIRIIKD